MYDMDKYKAGFIHALRQVGYTEGHALYLFNLQHNPSAQPEAADLPITTDFTAALKALQLFATESKDEMTLAMFKNFCDQRLNAGNIK